MQDHLMTLKSRNTLHQSCMTGSPEGAWLAHTFGVACGDPFSLTQKVALESTYRKKYDYSKPDCMRVNFI